MGILDGTGTKENEGSYKNNEREGKWIFYFETGGVADIMTFSMGKLAGKCTSYYKDGKTKEISNYKLGRTNEKSEYVSIKHGEWILYDSKGREVKREKYKNGKKTS